MSSCARTAPGVASEPLIGLELQIHQLERELTHRSRGNDLTRLRDKKEALAGLLGPLSQRQG